MVHWYSEPVGPIFTMEDDSQKFHGSELDEAWALALAEAEKRARAAGRTDLSTYLALRTSNDLLRQTGRDWLQERFTSIAGEAQTAPAAAFKSREMRTPLQNG